MRARELFFVLFLWKPQCLARFTHWSWLILLVSHLARTSAPRPGIDIRRLSLVLLFHNGFTLSHSFVLGNVKLLETSLHCFPFFLQ
jgi:hypothetical protein